MKPKRPHMPMKVKLDVALIALGLDPADVEWHHEPPLSVRPYDKATGKWTPDANDPKHIVPVASLVHAARFAADVVTAAKTKQITKKHEAFRAVLLAKTTGDDKPRDVRKRRIPSRPFQTKHGGFRGGKHAIRTGSDLRR